MARRINYDAKKISEGTYPTLKVWKGHGLTISLAELNGESVKQIWLDDPSKIVLDYAGELCNQPCRGGVNIVHLKRVEGLTFEKLPSTPSTTLTVVTTSMQGDRIYKFRITYGTGGPEYFTVNLQPQKPTPTPLNSVVATNRRLVEPDTKQIAVFRRGLAIAKTTLKDTTKNRLIFTRINLFISDLEKGKPLEDARKDNNLSEGIIAKLIELASQTNDSPVELEGETVSDRNN